MKFQHLDLDSLPVPNIVEDVDYEQLLEQRKKKLIELDPAYEQALQFETDPLLVDLQVSSYHDFLLRRRINEVAQARLLAKAVGTDLDYLGDFYGVNRFTEERDDLYRKRIRDRIIGSSTAGSLAHYKTRAMEVNPTAIKDISIDSPKGGVVRVSIFIDETYCYAQKKSIKELGYFKCEDHCTHKKEFPLKVANNCPEYDFFSTNILNEVSSHVGSDSVRMLTDTVEVTLTEKIYVDVIADVYLNPGMPKSMFENLKTDFLKAWDSEINLGFDVTDSWINSKLFRSGVHHIDLRTPTSIVSVNSTQAAKPGNIEITLKENKEF